MLRLAEGKVSFNVVKYSKWRGAGRVEVAGESVDGVEEEVFNNRRVACGRRRGRVRTYSTERWLCDG